MSEDQTPKVDTDDHVDLWDRQTAPQSPFTSRDVLIGIVVFIIGVIITVGIPIASLPT